MRNATGTTLCIIVWTLLVLFAGTSWGQGNVEHSHFVECKLDEGKFVGFVGCKFDMHVHPNAIQPSGEVEEWFADKHRDSDAVARQTLKEHAGGPPAPSSPPSEPKPPPQPPPPPPPPTPSRPSTSAPRPSTSRPSTPTETIVLPDPDEEIDPPDDTSAIDDPIEEVVEPEPVEMVRFEYGYWRKGFNLVSFPVMKPEIETLSDFYAYYSFMESPDDVLYAYIDGCWFAYNGQDDQIVGDVQITPYLGIVAVMDWSAWWALTGVEIIGDGAVELSAGLNIVGLSELPRRYQLPSDFLDIDGVEMVMVTGWDDVEKTNRFYTVGRAGDEGDDALYLGQAVILITSMDITLDMSEPVSAAPSARWRLTTSWGAIKQ